MSIDSSRTLGTILLLATLCGTEAAAAQTRYPEAPTGTDIDELHGVRVADPYRWLERTAAPPVQQWIKAEDAQLQAYLKDIAARSPIRKRIHDLNEYDLYSAPQLLNPPIARRGRRYFFVKIAAGKDKPVLYMREQARDRVVLDTTKRYAGEDIEIVGFEPSPDGHKVVVSLATSQSRWHTLHVLEVETGKPMESLSGGHNVGPGIEWQADSQGFFYTAFDGDQSDPQAKLLRARIMRHRLGEAQSQDISVFADLDTDPLYHYARTGDGRTLVIEVRHGSARATSVYVADLRATEAKPQLLIATPKADYAFLGSEGRKLYFYTDLHAANGRVIAVDIDLPATGEWQDVVSEAKQPIAGRSSVGGNAIGMFAGRIVLMYLADGQPFLRVFSTSGTLLRELALPTGGSIWGGFSGTPQDAKVYYQYLSMTDPSSIYELDLERLASTVFIRSRAAFDPKQYTVDRVFFTSSDGQRVPMLIAHKVGLRRNGSHPAWMYGYGAFGWVSFVWYQPQLLAWLDMGGIFAVPALRGGGELGEDWHQAGMKARRQNTINDFVEAGKWLVAQRYTTPKLLVANGGSASGAIAAAAIQQQPDLFGAAIIDRPILDLIRFDRFTAGSYWKPEFGDPHDENEFKVLFSYSPYHRIRAGVCYPPTLVMSGNLDQVADPSHAYKFTARMQAAQGCANPVLLKTMWGAGHNFGATPPQITDSWTDAMSFLAKVLRLRVPATWAREWAKEKAAD
jgi:prolyl oligopeptidase